jgi:hypothetical protein
VEESLEERDDGGKGSVVGGGGAGFERGEVDVPPVDNHQEVLVTLSRADGEATDEVGRGTLVFAEGDGGAG